MSDEHRPEREFDELLEGSAAYYSSKLREYGSNAVGMDWRDQASQYLRFERLLLHLEVEDDSSWLDVGCGNGEMLRFLERAGSTPRYLGIDVSEEMVEACNGRFGSGTAVKATLPELLRQGRHFDFVVASGTFNVKLDTPSELWGRFFQRSVEEMFRLADRAVVFNMMSSRVDYRYDHLYYAGVEEIAQLADRCGTRDFVVDHGYPLFEFTVSLFKKADRGA